MIDQPKYEVACNTDELPEEDEINALSEELALVIELDRELMKEANEEAKKKALLLAQPKPSPPKKTQPSRERPDEIS